MCCLNSGSSTPYINGRCLKIRFSTPYINELVLKERKFNDTKFLLTKISDKS